MNNRHTTKVAATVAVVAAPGYVTCDTCGYPFSPYPFTATIGTCRLCREAKSMYGNIHAVDGIHSVTRPRQHEPSRKLKELVPIACSGCGDMFQPATHHTRYCTDECRVTAMLRRMRGEPKEIVCVACEKVFTTTNGKRKVCGDECKRTWNKMRHAESRRQKREERAA